MSRGRLRRRIFFFYKMHLSRKIFFFRDGVFSLPPLVGIHRYRSSLLMIFMRRGGITRDDIRNRRRSADISSFLFLRESWNKITRALRTGAMSRSFVNRRKEVLPERTRNFEIADVTYRPTRCDALPEPIEKKDDRVFVRRRKAPKKFLITNVFSYVLESIDESLRFRTIDARQLEP